MASSGGLNELQGFGDHSQADSLQSPLHAIADAPIHPESCASDISDSTSQISAEGGVALPPSVINGSTAFVQYSVPVEDPFTDGTEIPAPTRYHIPPTPRLLPRRLHMNESSFGSIDNNSAAPVLYPAQLNIAQPIPVRPLRPGFSLNDHSLNDLELPRNGYTNASSSNITDGFSPSHLNDSVNSQASQATDHIRYPTVGAHSQSHNQGGVGNHMDALLNGGFFGHSNNSLTTGTGGYLNGYAEGTFPRHANNSLGNHISSYHNGQPNRYSLSTANGSLQASARGYSGVSANRMTVSHAYNSLHHSAGSTMNGYVNRTSSGHANSSFNNSAGGNMNPSINGTSAGHSNSSLHNNASGNFSGYASESAGEYARRNTNGTSGGYAMGYTHSNTGHANRPSHQEQAQLPPENKYQVFTLPNIDYPGDVLPAPLPSNTRSVNWVPPQAAATTPLIPFDDKGSLSLSVLTARKARGNRRWSNTTLSTPSRGRHNNSRWNPSSVGRSGRNRRTDAPADSQQLQGTTATSTQNLRAVQLFPLPEWYFALESGSLPTLNEAYRSMPFYNPFQNIPRENHGVIRFIGIPFTTTKNELLAAVGLRTRVVTMPAGTSYHAVHIIMDRSTGRTGDGFVEIYDTENAESLVARMNAHAQLGRGIRIGRRIVEVRLSSQEELMQNLFPLAYNVQWTYNIPQVIETRAEHSDEKVIPRFSGFCSLEELNMLIMFVETPTRSAFVERTPHRLYECIISTLNKYPWSKPEYVALITRKRMFDVVGTCLAELAFTLRLDDAADTGIGADININPALLQELAIVALSCVGFTEQQRWAFIRILENYGYEHLVVGYRTSAHLGGSNPFSSTWPFFALSPRPNADVRLLEYYIGLVRRYTVNQLPVTLADIAAATAGGWELKLEPFGDLLLDYNTDKIFTLSLRDAFVAEYRAIQRVLEDTFTNERRRLTPGPFELLA